MKLQNNLTRKKLADNVPYVELFKSYPYSILLTEFTSNYETLYLNGYLNFYKEGYDLEYLLTQIDDYYMAHNSLSRFGLLDYFYSIYNRCLVYDLPDPSRLIPVDLTKERQDLILKGYEHGIDASKYATNDITVDDLRHKLNALLNH